MCFTGQCRYERYDGDCDKPHGRICPFDDPEGAEAEVEALEWEMDDYYDQLWQASKERRHDD